MMESCGTPAYVAPEVLHKKGYRREVDMWSAGVIFFTLICRQLPFQGSDRKETFQFIKESQPDTTLPQFERFAPEAKDLMVKMLIKDPDLRIKPAQALKHPFFKKNKLFPEGTVDHEEAKKQAGLSVIVEENQSTDKKPNNARNGIEFTKVDKLSKHTISVNEDGNLEDSHSNVSGKKQPKETTYGKVTKANRAGSIRIRVPKDDMTITRMQHLLILDLEEEEAESPLPGVKNKTNKELIKLKKQLQGLNTGTATMVPSKNKGSFNFDLP
mmetsp:Transcript_13696/g.21464  ORF Transcript_13696/g.21464 Transcript_13696/m.21464 type:complete len:270 (-) Transcript_13696:298-1107(-)